LFEVHGQLAFASEIYLRQQRFIALPRQVEVVDAQDQLLASANPREIGDAEIRGHKFGNDNRRWLRRIGRKKHGQRPEQQDESKFSGRLHSPRQSMNSLAHAHAHR
jgi:hypothetical protein